MKEVVRMPSHRSLCADATAEQCRDHSENELVDEAAKGARSRYPENCEDAQMETEFYLRRVKAVAKAIAVAMALWPPRKDKLGRKRLERRNDEGNTRAPHEWAYVDGMWRCGACGTWRKEFPGVKAGGGGNCEGWGG